ncbi:uncharacterized protein TNCT_644571 [Trichonephila clavata]|uniref:Uncharacterized protein n=1 Tax=Trichonephila clavata TaxID=2740835 RepID=A0A8X6KL29_TRICU|nr:uncharacterized protein TNCT_644571 [Trichonephila clavata]
MEDLYNYNPDSCESNYSSESESKEPNDYLTFVSKITDELRCHFKRNYGKEEYCDDIFEDIFSTPVSGSFSYYSDLLAVAQRKNDRKENNKVIPETSEFDTQESSTAIFSEFRCSCACSGTYNPAMGAGPLEELFKVLEPFQQNYFFPSTANVSNINGPSYLSETLGPLDTTSNDIFCSPSLDDGYAEFIDIFHRWTADAFPQEFSVTNPNDF